MKISTKGRYALRFMLDLAIYSDGKYLPLKEISARQEISLKYLEQIVAQFSRLGFLDSVRGPQGGYRLARDPKDYTIGDILRCSEGSLAPVACLEHEVNTCPRQSSCGTLSFWVGFYKAIEDYVDSVTLADLVEEQRTKAANDFCI
ncbi:MAG: Rrf2 family transcriptional regulator [Lachnospiraceae bacterium]|nr:Rrf2 family transcriptional regulator [Lachnospiraceae bacterium]